MNRDWIYQANHILRFTALNFPGTVNYPALLRQDQNWNWYKPEFDVALNYLLHHNLVIESPPNSEMYKCSTEGKMISESGIETFIKTKTESEAEAQRLKQMNSELLQQQITELQRKNRTYHVRTISAVFIAALSLLLTVLQICDLI